MLEGLAVLELLKADVQSIVWFVLAAFVIFNVVRRLWSVVKGVKRGSIKKLQFKKIEVKSGII